MVINKVMYPKFAVHDPSLMVTMPHRELAFGTADIMTHLMEQYFTLSKDTDILDRYKEAGLKTVIEAGKRVLQDPTDQAAHANLLYVSAWACSDLSMCGAMGGWAAHMIEHEISAATDLNHGNGMAIIYPVWMQYLLDAAPQKFAQYGERVWGLQSKGRSPAEVGQEAIQRTVDFWTSLGISLKWDAVNVDSSVLPRAASQAVRFGALFSLRWLQDSDVLNILQMAS
jgi:alcohol dehydrogenase